MLFKLFMSMRAVHTGFNVFRYITFRTALSILTALVISFILGPWIIGRLKTAQPGNYVREYLPEGRSEEHTSELQSHSFISYAVFCLKKKN